MKELNLEDVDEILEKHHKFYNTNATKDIKFRIKNLNNLKNTIKKYEKEVAEALRNDLGKHEFEAYTTEIGMVYNSISEAVKNLKKWAKPKKVSTPIFLQPAKSFIMSEPYGTVLIIAPFNYPFELTMEPLIGAISAGNTVVIKPSEMCPHTSKIITKIISEVFQPEYVLCVEGEVQTSSSLINSPFDYIFFTGSDKVGRIVMESAAKNLIPVTLELGGKSPVIIDESANIDIAAQRVIWGKTLNIGQTCVAPDYVLIHNSIKDKFIEKAKETIIKFYGDNIKRNDNYGRIINEKHFNRLRKIIDSEKENIIYGGAYDRENLFIEPTLIDKSGFDGESMLEEIFGPILPIIGYDDVNYIVNKIRKGAKPLALYIFTENKMMEKKLLSSISSGGACVNDTIMHLANSGLPFGGVGNSGMGSYHGKENFNTFSHKKSILKKNTKVNLTMLFPPYTKGNFNLVKKFLK